MSDQCNYSLYSVEGVVIMDSEGNKLLSKYYQDKENDKLFEKELFNKTGMSSDLIIYKDKLVLYKSTMDLIVYLISPVQENELMLSTVLTGFIDAIDILLRHQLEKSSFIENLDMILLALDETIDGGIILETDSTAIANRVSRPKADTQDIQLNEQTLVGSSTL